MSISLHLLTLILISSVVCGIVIVICSILVCKFWYKYRRGPITIRNDRSLNVDENNLLLISDIYSEGQKQINIKESDGHENCQATTGMEKDDFCETNYGDCSNPAPLLNVIQIPTRRHSDDSPCLDQELESFVRTRSVSEIETLPTTTTTTTESRMNSKSNKNETYRKNSFHLRPFDLVPQMKNKISHSMEFISHKKTSSYEQIDERKVRSFDTDWICINSKLNNVINDDKLKSKELSKSLMSFIKKISKLKSKTFEDKRKSSSNILRNFKKSNNEELMNDLDLAYSCPYKISKNHQKSLQKKGSLESSLCMSSFDSYEMNEAFLAVSREIHNSCDSELCFRSAAVKRKQFYREKKKPININCVNGGSGPNYMQSSSANQSIERDYSIDERSSNIFKEYLRNDPSFDKFVMEENLRQRLRNERGVSHQNSQHRKSKSRVTDAFKSASFTDGDPHPLVNIHTNSYESQSDNTNRSPSPLPTIVLSSANQFQ